MIQEFTEKTTSTQTDYYHHDRNDDQTQELHANLQWGELATRLIYKRRKC
jgi:hypothetical protein